MQHKADPRKKKKKKSLVPYRNYWIHKNKRIGSCKLDNYSFTAPVLTLRI